MEVFRSTDSFIATANKVREVALSEENLQGNQNFLLRIPWMASAAIPTRQASDAAAT